MDYSDFWGKLGPGLLNLGAGLYTSSLANKDAASKLTAAQGPVYNAATSGTAATLGDAGNFDPNAFAAQRFAQQQALVAPVQQKQVSDLTRQLYARGMLGAGVYNPGVEGYTPNGSVVNPQLAALYAAQAAQQSKDAYGALDQGQNYLNTLVSRANSLNSIAGNAQATGIRAQATQPSRATQIGEFLNGGVSPVTLFRR